MDVMIREMSAADLMVWTHLRAELWPEDSMDDHQRHLEDLLRRGKYWGIVAELPAGNAVGFVELAVRDYANGCFTQPVAFLEGIWVRPQFRRQRIGSRLLKAAETFLIVRGLTEIGSDALIDNSESHAAHTAWGFEETERVVYFRKDLKPNAC